MRDHEANLRESGWHQAQAGAARHRGRQGTCGARALDGTAGGGDAGVADGDEPMDGAAVAAWEARIAELRTRRDRLGAQVATHDAERREADGQHARARRPSPWTRNGSPVDRETAALAERERALESERERVRTELAAATAREHTARTAVDEVRAADAADRERLAAAERAATGARERLRAADERLRTADHARLEARLALDALREQLLVELAGLGALGLARLREVAGLEGTEVRRADTRNAEPGADDTEADADVETADVETAALAAALDTVAGSWSASAPAGEPPSPGRLATLRRRFHELGAVNPFAVRSTPRSGPAWSCSRVRRPICRRRSPERAA